MSDSIVPGGTTVDPSYCFVAVTKSDSVKITYNGKPARAKGLYIGSGGDVAVKDVNGNSVTFVAVPTGTTLKIATDQLLSTGTSASSVVALL